MKKIFVLCFFISFFLNFSKVLAENMADSKNSFYVAAVKFYNGKENDNLNKVIKNIFSQENHYIFCCTEKESNADYVLYPKVSKIQIKKEKNNPRILEIMLTIEQKNNKTNSAFAQSQQAFKIIDNPQDDQKIVKDMLEKSFLNIAKLIYTQMINKFETLKQNKQE